jgi:hypothetical protein
MFFAFAVMALSTRSAIAAGIEYPTPLRDSRSEVALGGRSLAMG